jgi:hypothetical protein
MSHRTAATALLLASLPYGIALPQVLPLPIDLAPNATPLLSAFDASTVTVVGTIVQPAVESAIESVADVVEDATSAVESPTDVLPTPSIVDPAANILPLILPGILPVETDLPPLETDLPTVNTLDVVSSALSSAVVSTLPTSIYVDLPDTNSLEVIDLPAPTDEPISKPPVPGFPEEATVPISTFNAVVQPLLSVIQTLLNAMPGNYAPPLPGILVNPLRPTETPDIFVDPLLPTETFSDATIPTLAPSIATDLPFAQRFAKRQTPSPLSASALIDLLTPILNAIQALLRTVALTNPTTADLVSGAVSEVASVVPALATLPVEVPTVSDTPMLPIPNISLPAVTDILPKAIVSDLPAVSTPDILPQGIPDDVLNVPVPDDFQAIDWAAYESPPIWTPPTSSDEPSIPDDVLNVAVPDFDELGNIIDAPLSAVSAVTAAPAPAVPTSLVAVAAEPLGVVSAVVSVLAPPQALPTSLDAFGDVEDLGDADLAEWPFTPVPDTVAPDATGELPDLNDISTPDTPTDTLAGLSLPLDAPSLLAVPTNVWDVPVPEGFEDIVDSLPEVTSVASAIPTSSSGERPIPPEVLALLGPELDENGFPIDTPVSAPSAPSTLPSNLNWWEIPVPDDFIDSDLPAPTPELPDVLPALPSPDPPAPVSVASILPVAPVVAPGVITRRASLPFQVPSALRPLAKRQWWPRPAWPIPGITPGFPIPGITPGYPIPGITPGFPIPGITPGFPFSGFKPPVFPIPTPVTPASAASSNALTAVKPLLDLVSTLLALFPDLKGRLPNLGDLIPASLTSPVVPVAPGPPKLPLPGVPGFGGVPTVPGLLNLPVSGVPGLTNLPNVLPPLPTVPSLSNLGGILPPLPNLIPTPPVAPLPAPTPPTIVPAVPVAPIVSDLLSNVGGILPTIPTPALSSLVPLPLPTSGFVSPVSAVPGISEVLTGVLPVVSSVLPAVATILPIVSKVPKVPVLTAALAPVAGLLKPLPTVLPLDRREEQMQEGPASDWESFLGELDEPYQSELAGLIHDSAKAFNNAEVDAMTATLRADFDNLSADTKAKIASATLTKRAMRHGKRQRVPGVLSLGPNLDDADKEFDLSAILGPNKSLDPNGMLSQDGVQAQPEDFFQDAPLELDDSSVSPVSSSSNAELASLIEAGGLDPNGMLDPVAHSPLSFEAPEQNPYEDLQSNWDSALDTSRPAQAIEGLDATIQASKANHIGNDKVPKLPFSSAEAAYTDAQAQAQGGVMGWFQRNFRPSLDKSVDAEIVR